MIPATVAVNPVTVADNPDTTAARPPVNDKLATLVKPKIPAMIPKAIPLLSALLLALLAVDCASVPAFLASIILWFNPLGGGSHINWPKKLNTCVPCVSICCLEYVASLAALFAVLCALSAHVLASLKKYCNVLL